MTFCLGVACGPLANYLTPKSDAIIAYRSADEQTGLLVGTRKPRRVLIIPRNISSNECWGGIWNAYDENYPVGLDGQISPDEWSDVIGEVNDIVSTVFPCCCSIGCALCCCPCTCGTSCLYPSFFMHKVESQIIKILNQINQDFKDRGVVFRFRRKLFIASWIEIELSDSHELHDIYKDSAVANGEPSSIQGRRSFRTHPHHSREETKVAPQVLVMNTEAELPPYRDPSASELTNEFKIDQTQHAPIPSKNDVQAAVVAAQSMNAYPDLESKSSQTTKDLPPAYEAQLNE